MASHSPWNETEKRIADGTDKDGNIDENLPTEITERVGKRRKGKKREEEKQYKRQKVKRKHQKRETDEDGSKVKEIDGD